MKIYFSTIYLTLLFTLSAYQKVYSQTGTNHSNYNVKLTKNPTLPKTDKPRMPAMLTVDCWYGNGELSIEFRDPEGECDITVTDTATGFTVTDTFDSTLPYTIYIGTPQSATITLSTEEGNTYYGEIH